VKASIRPALVTFSFPLDHHSWDEFLKKEQNFTMGGTTWNADWWMKKGFTSRSSEQVNEPTNKNIMKRENSQELL
jgi:hypothetical protein